MAMAFLGSFAASFERRWAYSSAVMPGVTGQRTYQQCRCIDDASTYALQLLVSVGGFHGEVDRIGAPQRK